MQSHEAKKYDLKNALTKTDVKNGESSQARILQYIKKESIILECGPAYGYMTRYLKEELSCKVYIIEYDSEAFHHAIQFAHDGICADLDQNEWVEALEQYGERFDYILCADVLEHLRNPGDVLKKLGCFLKQNGKLLLSIPNVAHNDIIANLFCDRFTYTSLGLLDNTHIHLFAKNDAERMFRESGFAIKERGRITLPQFFSEQGKEFTAEQRIRFGYLSEQHPTGDVYQYVYCLQLCDEVSHDAQTIEVETPIVHKAIIYFDSGEGYSEKETMQLEPIAVQAGHHVYDANLPEKCKRIRLDPVELSGCLIRDVHITINEKQAAFRCLNGFESEGEYFFVNPDPQIEIEILGEKGVHHVRMEYWIEGLYCSGWKGVDAIVGRISNALHREMAQCQQLSVEYGCLQREHQQLEVEHKSLSRKYHQMKEELQNLQETYQQLVAENTRLERKCCGLEEESNHQQNECVRLRNELSHLLDEHGKLQWTYAQVKEAYDIVINSTFWKATAGPRKLLDALKRMAACHCLTRALYKGLAILSKDGVVEGGKKIRQKLLNGKRKKELDKQRFGQQREFVKTVIYHLSDAERDRQKQTKFNRKIKFSIVVPLYNTQESFLNDMIRSIQAQTYENWELCLSDGSDALYQTAKTVCCNYQKKDVRILYKRLNKNGGIGLNTVAAYEMATGEYIVLLDHDDVLTEDALFMCAQCIENDPHADFIYSDKGVFEDKTGRLLAYHYLPDYSPEFLRAMNYASHLNVFSRWSIQQGGFIQEGYDGSQDYDLELRITEKARSICHIPHVLYYCRACEGSVALKPESKMYAYEAGRKALEEHIRRIGFPGEVEFLRKTYSYRIHYDIVHPGKVSIIIPNKDHLRELKTCLESILEQTEYDDYEIVVVENSSQSSETFSYYQEIEKNPRVRVLYYTPPIPEFNFSAINNYAVKQIDTPYILFLNNDTKVIGGNWLTEMLMFAQRPDVGAVGAKLYYPDDTYQHIGLFVGLGDHIATHYAHRSNRGNTGYMHRLSMPQNYNAVTGACMLVKREDFVAVGGFDEVDFKVGLNDVDICLKFRELGRVNVLTPYAELYHFESVSRKSDETGPNKIRFQREQQLFRKKWSKYFDVCDTYYNCNLTI